MAQDVVRALAVEQRKRLVASLLQFAESQPWYKQLPHEDRKALRDKVLDSVGSYHDFMLDVIKVRGETFEQSEEGLRLLHAIHAAVRSG